MSDLIETADVVGTVGSASAPPAPLRDFQSVGFTPETSTRTLDGRERVHWGCPRQ